MDCNLQQVKNNNVAMTGPYKMNAIVRVGIAYGHLYLFTTNLMVLRDFIYKEFKLWNDIFFLTG